LGAIKRFFSAFPKGLAQSRRYEPSRPTGRPERLATKRPVTERLDTKREAPAQWQGLLLRAWIARMSVANQANKFQIVWAEQIGMLK
jgi:hypothetical protein